jgi:hypothetical protein
MSDSSFEELWKAAVRYRHVAPRAEALVRAVYQEASPIPANELRVVDALEALLEFLASSEGRTDANCSVTDSFFAALEGRWEHLGKPLQEILSDLGGTLHDAIFAPQISSTFDTLPEQLLSRVKSLRQVT